ncbi:MAG: hypothetical protein U0324_46230 [Polyangiales bacterium]
MRFLRAVAASPSERIALTGATPSNEWVTAHDATYAGLVRFDPCGVAAEYVLTDKGRACIADDGAPETDRGDLPPTASGALFTYAPDFFAPPHGSARGTVVRVRPAARPESPAAFACGDCDGKGHYLCDACGDSKGELCELTHDDARHVRCEQCQGCGRLEVDGAPETDRGDLPPVEDIAQAPIPPAPAGSLARMLTERPDGDEPDAGPVEAPPVPTPRERAAVVLAAALVAVAAWCTAARATASVAALPPTVDILAALATALADPRPRALESLRLRLAAWVHAAERQWFANLTSTAPPACPWSTPAPRSNASAPPTARPAAPRRPRGRPSPTCAAWPQPRRGRGFRSWSTATPPRPSLRSRPPPVTSSTGASTTTPGASPRPCSGPT